MLQNEKQKTRLFMPHLIHCTESDSRENCPEKSKPFRRLLQHILAA